MNLSTTAQVDIAFAGVRIELRSAQSWIADELRMRFLPAAPATVDARTVLRIDFDEIQPGWIEARDTHGRCERGPMSRIAYFARKWVTAAIVESHADLCWLHGAAAGIDGRAAVLVGPAGSGKSTVLAALLRRGWSLLGDDAVAIDTAANDALVPLPMHPEMRPVPAAPGEWAAFLSQVKALAAIPRLAVERRATPVGTVVFPEFDRSVAGATMDLQATVRTAQALVAQSLVPCRSTTVRCIFGFASRVPGQRLVYSDAERAADILSLSLRSCG